MAASGDGSTLIAATALFFDGQIHFSILPGSVTKNRHLLDRTVA